MKRGKKTRQTEEEVRRQHQGMDRPGVRQVPEGSGEQGKMEETGCGIIRGAPTTLTVKGTMMIMMMMMMMMMTMMMNGECKRAALGGSNHRNFQAANHPSSFSQSERHKYRAKIPKSDRHVWLTSCSLATERKSGEFRIKPSK